MTRFPAQWSRDRLVRRAWRVLVLALALGVGTASCIVSAETPSTQAEDTVRLVVLLSEPESVAGEADGNKVLRTTQDAALVSLLDVMPQAHLERRLQHALNALVLRVPSPTAGELERLRSLDQVRGVYSESIYAPVTLRPDTLDSLSLSVSGSSPELTANGAGVRVAIIGDGIAVDHPMLAADGLSYPNGYPKGDSRYTSPKVIASRTYLSPLRPPLTGEETPLPGVHGGSVGTYCAGLIAGRAVTADYYGINHVIEGHASGARLLNYRVFYPVADGSGPVAYTVELLAAIEDAVADGAQVIYAPWTSVSARSPADAPVAQALRNAMEAGCIVVAAAGDARPAEGSASRLPAGMAEVIAVGAVTGDTVVSTDLLAVTLDGAESPELSDRPYARAEFGAVITAPVGPFEVVDVATAAGSSKRYACDPLPSGSLAGAWALVPRGECSFAAKAYHAQQAGAVGLLVYNDDETIIGMACGDGEYCEPGVITIPAVMVARSVGEGLVEALGVSSEVLLALEPDAKVVVAEPNLLLESSARGPAFGRIVKPDLVAPGQGMLSAVIQRDDGRGPYALMSGSAVAGALATAQVARMIEAHPSWDQTTMRSVLAQTAIERALVSSGGAEASVLAQGAGVMATSVSDQAALLLEPALSSVIDIEPWTSREVALSLRDLRSWGGSRRWEVALEASAGLTLSMPSEIALAAGHEATVPISLTLLSGNRAIDQEAHVWLTSGAATLHWPIWVRPAAAMDAAGVLVIDNDFSNFENYVDYSPYVEEALDDADIDYDVWNADEHYDQVVSLPSVQTLRGYETIIWLTGDHKHADGYYDLHTPLTAGDLDALAAYLDGGGRLLALGQNLAEASDINDDSDPTWGRAPFYHAYLGAHWLQGSVFGPEGQGISPPQGSAAVVGVPDSFLSGVALNLGPVGDGEGNQVSVDEIGVGGQADGDDLDLVQPLLAAVGIAPVDKGWLAVAKGDDPSLEKATPAIDYRTVYMSFGLEGVNTTPDTTTREELMSRTLQWLRDEVTATLPETMMGAPNTPLALVCQAESSEGLAMQSYRWRIDGPGESRSLVTEVPTLTLSYEQEGTFLATVEATDAVGHRDVAQGSIEIVAGGTSTFGARQPWAVTGGTLAYVLTLRNTLGSAVTFDVTLPIPEGCEAVYSTAGEVHAGSLRWQGSLAPDEGASLELGVAISLAMEPGGMLAAVADVKLGASTLVFTSDVPIRQGVYLPLTEDITVN